jgi:hypothetical protein
MTTCGRILLGLECFCSHCVSIIEEQMRAAEKLYSCLGAPPRQGKVIRIERVKQLALPAE